MAHGETKLERLASCMINLCENLSIDLGHDVVKSHERLRDTLALLIALNLNVSSTDERLKMGCNVGGVKYIDGTAFEYLWNLCATHSNLLGDTESCVFAVGAFCFKDLEKNASLSNEKEMNETSKVHRAVEKVLPVEVKEGGWNVTDTMRALLLCSMDRVKRRHAVSEYCKTRFDGAITDEDVQNVFELLVDVKTKGDRFVGIIEHLFENCALLNADGLKDAICRKGEAKIAAITLRACDKSRDKQSASRPSIRNALERMPRLDGEVSQGFRGMCDQICFSNLTSPMLKHTVYFLLCQSHLLHPHEVMNQFLTGELLENATEVEVSVPVAEDVAESIRYFSYAGRPFSELDKFRAIFTRDYVDASMKNLNLTQVFHLYLAIYQQPSVRKEVWKLLRPRGRNVASVTRDAELFASKSLFASGYVLEALVRCNK